MRLGTAILAGLAAMVGNTTPLPPSMMFTPSSSYCTPNPRNDRAAADKRAARKRRNITKRGGRA